MVTKYWRCSSLLESLHKTLQKRLAIADLEHEIQRMEAELSYHREKTRIFEKVLQEQQHILSQLKKVKNKNCIGVI